MKVEHKNEAFYFKNYNFIIRIKVKPTQTRSNSIKWNVDEILNDKEFESLSIDLISKDKDKRFERFKAGKDSGIDGRFYHDDGSQEIVQCKHYLKTGFKGLITSLNKKNNSIINN